MTEMALLSALHALQQRRVGEIRMNEDTLLMCKLALHRWRIANKKARDDDALSVRIQGAIDEVNDAIKSIQKGVRRAG